MSVPVWQLKYIRQQIPRLLLTCYTSDRSCCPLGTQLHLSDTQCCLQRNATRAQRQWTLTEAAAMRTRTTRGCWRRLADAIDNGRSYRFLLAPGQRLMPLLEQTRKRGGSVYFLIVFVLFYSYLVSLLRLLLRYICSDWSSIVSYLAIITLHEVILARAPNFKWLPCVWKKFPRK